ncbi:apolipoprotein L4-like [Clarias gariepinus]
MTRSCSFSDSVPPSRGAVLTRSNTTPVNEPPPRPMVPPRLSTIQQRKTLLYQSHSVEPAEHLYESIDDGPSQRNYAEDTGYVTVLPTKTLAESSPKEKLHTKCGVFVTQQALNSPPFCPRSISVDSPVQNSPRCQQDAEANADFMEWWESEKPWKEVGFSDIKKDDVKAFTQKAENLKRALNVYDQILSERGVNLRWHIIELQKVANGIDKVHKGVKIAGITGGAAGAVGVAAAVGGVLLAPVTLGASLAVTAVGAGVAAAGGVTGASAAITNKVHTNMDRKKVEIILKDHFKQIEEIEMCIKVISCHIEYLKNPSTWREVDCNTVKVAKMAHKLGDSIGVIGAASKSSDLIKGFALGLNIYFTKEDSEQLKKGSEATFAKKIRNVAKQMQTNLDELMTFKAVVRSEYMQYLRT